MLSASSNLGYSLMRSGNELVAFELLSKVHNMYTIKLGEAHRDTAQAAVKLSECALRVGLFESASMNSIAALRVLDSLAIDHPLRAYAATVAMQCFDQVGNEYQNYRLHKRYVERLFRNGGPRAEEVRAFLEENPDYYPAQDSLPDDEASVFTLWLNIAWDGAVNWGDVDCMCVIGCANMSAEGYYLLDEAVGGRGIKLASSPQPSHWLNRIVTEHPQSPPAKFAASLLDDNHPIQMRRKKSLSVLKRIHEVVPNSAYFGHPMQFGRLPPK